MKRATESHVPVSAAIAVEDLRVERGAREVLHDVSPEGYRIPVRAECAKAEGVNRGVNGR